jgi:hypothetical protein
MTCALKRGQTLLSDNSVFFACLAVLSAIALAKKDAFVVKVKLSLAYAAVTTLPTSRILAPVAKSARNSKSSDTLGSAASSLAILD